MRKPFFDTDARKYAEALRLNVDLPLLALLRADLAAVCIIRPHKPVAVPAVFEYRVIHERDLISCAFRFLRIAEQFCKLCIFFPVFDKHACDKDRLRDGTFAWAECLEGFTRMLREAVEIQTVIPVCASDERQLVRAFVGYDVVK